MLFVILINNVSSISVIDHINGHGDSIFLAYAIISYWCTHTHTHIYIYIYIYIRASVCFFSFSISLSLPSFLPPSLSLSLSFCTIARYGYVWNLHRMSIKIEHRNLEIRKTRNDFSVQVRNIKGFDVRKGDTHSFYSGFFICPPTPNTCGTHHKGFSEQAKLNGLVRCSVLNSLTFSKSPEIVCVLPVCDAIRTRLPPFPISGYCEISEWHVHSARAHKHLC